jgi:uncharacterized protein (DUF4415 family)
MTENVIKKTRGGKRAGAGAKHKSSTPRKMVSIRLPTDLVDKLKISGESQADQIEKALRGFYNWEP